MKERADEKTKYKLTGKSEAETHEQCHDGDVNKKTKAGMRERETRHI
jgi:hypothetical protein